jgi:hypothetical protein
LVPQWTIAIEIGTRFCRYPFNHALALPSMAQGRTRSLTFCVWTGAPLTESTH